MVFGSSSSNYVTALATALVRYKGILFALFSSVCMSLITLQAKLMEEYNPVSKVIWRLQGILLPSLLILVCVKFYKKQALIQWHDLETKGIDENWKWKIFFLLFIRGIFGGSADIFQYYSLKYLPLADSTVISYSTPIFVCILAKCFLKEEAGLITFFAAALTLCGVIVITQPSIFTGKSELNSNTWFGNIMAIMCMIFATFTTIIMRCLRHCHFSMPLLALGVIGTVEGLTVCLFTAPFQLPKNLSDWNLAFVVAVLLFLGQLSQTLALKYEEANVVSLVRTCDIIFAFVWQVNLQHQKATVSSYIGAVIVSVGVCIITVQKWLSVKPDNIKT